MRCGALEKIGELCKRNITTAIISGGVFVLASSLLSKINKGGSGGTETKNPFFMWHWPQSQWCIRIYYKRRNFLCNAWAKSWCHAEVKDCNIVCGSSPN